MSKCVAAVASCVLLLAGVSGCSNPPSSSGENAANSESLGPPNAEDVAGRAQLAESGRFLRPAGATGRAPVDGSWAAALDIAPENLVATNLTSSAGAAAIRDGLGIIRPIRNASFVLLGTGIVGAGVGGLAPPEPGTDFDPVGLAGDVTTLELDLKVPDSASKLSFQYNFLSSESPDFLATVFNDTFSVRIVDGSGERNFVLASVNSSQFFDASDSRAKGTGFDIFADDPSGVDGAASFGGLLPDAGLTDFQSLAVDVKAGDSLHLVFSIQDNGDGILDSTVILDAVQFSAIEAVDPNPELLIAGGTLSRNLDDLVTRGRQVRGVVADGATDVLLRMKVPGPGTVQFSLPGVSPENGSLRGIDGAGLGGAVTTDTVTVAGESWALALYQAPADFTRTGDEALTDRAIQIGASYVPAPGGLGAAFTAQVDLQIKRPPVVLARGLWSTSAFWTPITPHDPAHLLNDSRFAVTLASRTYSCDNELRLQFAPNAVSLSCPWQRTGPPDGTRLCDAVLEDTISAATAEALSNVRRLDIAASRVDLVAHGDTGVQARRYINSPAYRNDVNRLITLNAPHLGTNVVDAVVATREKPDGVPSPEDFLCKARAFSGVPVDQGDIDILKTQTIGLARTPVPAHALVGTGGNKLVALQFKARAPYLSSLYGNITSKLNVRVGPGLASRCNVLGTNDHDLLVEVASQKGGIDPKAQTEFLMSALASPDPAAQTDFYHSTRSNAVSTRLVELLNSPLSGPFAEFPDGTTQAQPCPEVAIASPARANEITAAVGRVRIVSPASGTEVFAGDAVTVQVVAEDGFVPASVLAVVNDSSASTEVQPFTLEVPIPAETLGPTRLFAVGFDADENAVVSEIVVLNVKTRASLQAVEVLTQDPVLFGVGKKRQLSVVGAYDDGVNRDIVSSAVGTQYRSSNEGIVTVSPEGLLTATGTGIATVTVRNGTVQDSITVTVKGNQRPFAHVGKNLVLACASPGATVPVQLDGSASFDPEGAPLTFAWFEGNVPLASGPTPVVVLGPGDHQIELVVSDDSSSSSPAGMIVSIAPDTEPPSLQLLGDNPKAVECGLAFADDGALATDACDGDLTARIAAVSDVDASAAGDYRVSYQVQDSVGLTATATRSVRVLDTTPPTIACPPDQLIQTTGDTGTLVFTTTERDTCGVASASCTLPSGSSTPLGPSTNVCTVTDVGGNQARCSFGVFTNAPPRAACADAVVPADASCQGSGSVDNGSSDPNLDLAGCVQSPSGPYHLGSQPVTLTCNDTHEASASCIANVMVVDQTPPSIACPVNPSIECRAGGGAASFTAVSTDNCSLASQTCIPASGSTFPVGTSQATCTATDGTGNAASCSFSVTVRDTIAPAIVTTDLPAVLWPPNHKYRTFRLSDCVTRVSDQCGGDLDISTVGKITRVTSDEPERDRCSSRSQTNDDTDNDIVITGATSVELRAERRGDGDGRVYTVFFDVTDASGNVSSGSCKVAVPHDRSGDPAVGHGCRHCEGTGCGGCPGHNQACP